MNTPRDSGAALRLVDKGEAWDTPLDNFVFWCLLWTNGEDYFAHRYPTRKLPEDPSLSELAKLAQLIPRAAYQPEIPPGLTAAPIPPPDGCYVKLACLFGFNPEKSGDTSVAEGVLREARICEKLVNNPHPNICRYYGYIEKDGRIAGLCFEHHDQTLDEYKASGGQLDVDPIVEGVRSGLDHLHGLGIVHNDINPRNIMLDKTRQAVIIDFDSCQPLGAELEGKKGTPNWSREAVYSEVENDIFGLEKTEEFLRKSEVREGEASTL